jgi:Flp pilus assembly protein TadG
MFCRILNCVRKPLHHLITDEEGGAYTLSYVMVIPILMLLICLTIETTLLMSAKVGTSWSAYASARTAIVWASATENWSDAENKIEEAAVQAFVPFSTGMGAKGTAPDRATDYAKSYAEFADKPAASAYIKNKYANANERLKVTINGGKPASHDADITVTVEYRFRFNIPGIGKLIGEKDGDGYSFPVKSTATLQNEGPKNDQQALGIGYGLLD